MPKTYTPPAAFNDPSEYIEIALQPVESSQVKEIGYDPATKTLAVTFTRGIGSVYQYVNVPQEIHAAFVAADSIGKYFGAHIKDRFEFKKFAAAVAA